MAEAKRCKKCGAVYPDSAKKCPFCKPERANARMISVLYGPPRRFLNICNTCKNEWVTMMGAAQKCPKCGNDDIGRSMPDMMKK